MNKPGWNPARRNRKIGTSDSGWGQDNQLTIPQDWHDARIFWERLHNPVAVSRQLSFGELTILVEPTTQGFIHPCTPDDVFTMAALLPSQDFCGLSTVVLRQPRRKEVLLSPVWGRLGYWAALGQHSGPTVFLEAQEIGSRLRWNNSMRPDGREELRRLIDDGHRVEKNRRHYEWILDRDACRSTQLYRTLIHEVGHFVDKKHSIDDVVANLDVEDPRRSAVVDRYWSKSKNDKEAFAHRYASEVTKPLRQNGDIPFDQSDLKEVESFGAQASWFA